MTGAEMLKELQESRIAPILTFDRDGKTIVPMFKSKRSGERFAQRNTPKDWAIGTMKAGASDIKKIVDAGWVIEVFHFPRRIPNLRVEVLEIDREVQTNNCGYRRHI